MNVKPIAIARRAAVTLLFGPLLVSFLLLTSCGKKDSGAAADQKRSASGRKIVVGFSQIGAESAWRTANTESIKAEAAKRGVDLRFADAQQKQENQIKALRSFMSQGVDVIAF